MEDLGLTNINMNIKNMEGGCLCGAVRYCVSSSPFAAEYCHCSICQKNSGAPVVSWMDFHTNELTWTKGKPTKYKSSEYVTRGFCKECGSSFSFYDTRHPEYITLTIASLDNPNLVKPIYHIYTDSQLKWLTIDDDLKRFPKGPEKSS